MKVLNTEKGKGEASLWQIQILMLEVVPKQLNDIS